MGAHFTPEVESLIRGHTTTTPGGDIDYTLRAQAVAGLRNCKALFPDLTPTCVPYMFALQIEYPEQHFHQLKHLGLPIWRWDEMAVSDCAVSTRYRLHLLHLPCHQSLTQGQMQWMTAAATKVLA